MIETQILPDFDIGSYREFKKLEKTDEALYLHIKAKITSAEEEWSLLFAGFDDARAPHLFVISGPGKVEYCDHQKVAAIGTGAFAALLWLAFYGYHPQRPLGELLFASISAKFFAERARDVGPTTVVSTIKSDIPALFHFNSEDIIKVRTSWENMPKFDSTLANEFDTRMRQMYEMVHAAEAAKQRTAFQSALIGEDDATQSASRKSGFGK